MKVTDELDKLEEFEFHFIKMFKLALGTEVPMELIEKSIEKLINLKNLLSEQNENTIKNIEEAKICINTNIHIIYNLTSISFCLQNMLHVLKHNEILYLVNICEELIKQNQENISRHNDIIITIEKYYDL